MNFDMTESTQLRVICFAPHFASLDLLDAKDAPEISRVDTLHCFHHFRSSRRAETHQPKQAGFRQNKQARLTECPKYVCKARTNQR